MIASLFSRGFEDLTEMIRSDLGHFVFNLKLICWAISWLNKEGLISINDRRSRLLSESAEVMQ